MKNTLCIVSLTAAISIASANVTIGVNASNYFSLADNIPSDGTIDGVSSGIAAGEIDDEGSYQNWSFTTEAISEGVIQFSLPDIPEGMELQSATITWAITVYDPSSNPSLGNLQAYHSQSNLDSGSPVFSYIGIFAEPTVNDGYLASLDVTSFILSDYTSDGVTQMADFQFKADGISFNDDGRVSAYLLRDLQPDYPLGELSLEFSPIPEPRSYAMIVGLMTLTATLRTRRSSQRR